MSAPRTAADVATVGSVASAGTSWVASANEIVSLIAGCIAIIAGLFAIHRHLKSINRDKRDGNA